MNIIGSMYIMDASGMNALVHQLSVNPPPRGILSGGTIICMDMDETTDDLERMFPEHCTKATIFCPPPSVMIKEIDGDGEGFIIDYNDYLEHDETVQEFIATMLLFLHVGGQVLLYSPAMLNDGAVWLNTLLLFFYTRYGITIGTPTNEFSYDPNYDATIIDLLYSKNCINVFDYCNGYPDPTIPSINLIDKVYYELSHFCGPGENPRDLYQRIKMNVIAYGVPILKPGVIFMEK